MRKLIKVKQSHIDEARIRIKNGGLKSCNCPIALALKEHFKARNVAVGVSSFSIDYNHLADTPRSCKRFIIKFDSGKPVKPFNFFFKS